MFRIPSVTKLSIFFFFVFFFYGATHTKADLFIPTEKIYTEPKTVLQNQKVTLYATIENNGDENTRGVIRVFDITEGKKVEQEQPFTLPKNSSGKVFLEFTPEKLGNHDLALRIIPWENYETNNPENDKIPYQIFVDLDTDKDGTGNRNDTDDDNDGVKDTEDLFPLDASEWKDNDNDGVGDNKDDDDDNDGIKDSVDLFPTDNTESFDSDNDGVGNNQDDDDDGDGISDDAEKQRGTDPEKFDTDDDGINDGEDDFPLDKKFQYDTDKDGIPNKKDKDDDGDNVIDSQDAFPLNPKETKDFDKDGVGDIEDPDDDNDRLLDLQELQEGTDVQNPDTDGDGVIDGEDAAPLDPTEQKDSDNDGLGDNKDPNDNNKGPVVEVKEIPSQVFRSEPIVLDASASFDPEGALLLYYWEIKNSRDEIIASFYNPTIQFTSSGIGDYKIGLIVTDIADESRSDEFTVKVVLSSYDKWIIGGVIFAIIFLIGGGIWLWRRKK